MRDLGLKLFTAAYVISFLVGIFGLSESYRQFDLVVIKESLTTGDYKSLVTNSLFLYAINFIAILIALIGLFIILMERRQTEKV